MLLNLVLVIVATQPVLGQQPAEFKSKNFVMRTDVPKEEAEKLLKKLETMVALVSKYWAVPNRRPIRIYVVADLKNWPANSIDHRALNSLRAKAGITLADYRRVGNRSNVTAVAYSFANHRIVQHEAVHAYCYLAFGRTGPKWYAEGMAEMGAMWVEGETRVTAPKFRTEFLRRAERKSIKDITQRDTNEVGSWKTYSYRWALCHLLANNTNYARRFRPLGLEMLTARKASFTKTYGKQSRELEFEYNFFLDHVQPGFDVAACSWDWDASFRKPKSNKPVTSTIQAMGGWQPSGVSVEAGKTYRWETSGTWQIEKDGDKLTAAGRKPGRHGCLAAVIMTRFKLGEPFQLGVSGEITPEESGDLYFRCNDQWGAISNNSGEMIVSLVAAESTAKVDKK